MGATLWMQLTDGVTVIGGDRDNSIMLRLASELDAVAARLGVRRLSAFHDMTGVSFIARILQRRGAWFNIEEGRRTFGSVLVELRERPESLGFVPDRSRAHWPSALIDELEYCLSMLNNAAPEQKQFRIRVVS